MGAAEVLTDPSSLYEAGYVGNVDLSDMDMVHTVRHALASVKNGESDLYDELVRAMQVNKYSDPVAVAAQLEIVLNALSGSVAYLDTIHHGQLLSLVFRMSLWDLKPHVMDALVGLLIKLAVTSGEYLESCLNMLIGHFVPPNWVISRLTQARVINQKIDVLSRVHKALLEICRLVPLAPSSILPKLQQNMPKTNKKDQVVVMYVENLLKLENSPIGQVGGNKIFMMVMERLRDLDVDWDDILQDDSSRGMFDMELEDAVEDAMNEGDELPKESHNQNALDGNIVFESLDKLMVICFDHLESCQLAGRLDQVFEKLFESFENFILNTDKSKVSQFLMFYACSLDPENCGVKFASKLMDIFLSSNKPTRKNAVAYLASYLARGKFLPVSYVASMLKRFKPITKKIVTSIDLISATLIPLFLLSKNFRLVDECADYCRTCSVRPEAHKIFYSGCQAIMYVLCFRMRSILDVPRFRSELIPLESVLMHKLNPLMVCLPTIVAEFLRQAKAGGLFVVSDSFIDQLESDRSRAFGGCERLDTFFPFDPCLLKSTNSFISPNFMYWSMVRPTYDEDDDDEDAEIVVNGDEESDEEDEDDFDYDMNKMSITPKHSFKNKMERDRLMKMPSIIRPSTIPESF